MPPKRIEAIFKGKRWEVDKLLKILHTTGKTGQMFELTFLLDFLANFHLNKTKF